MMLKLGILFAVALFLETASAASLGVVQTEGGKVEGKSISLGSGRSMDIFLGVPFADAPGTFEKPRPHRGWDGILQAKDYKPRCLQLTVLMNDYIGSTDCLYLNIWVPHGSSGLPVMVWIYGGLTVFVSNQLEMTKCNIPESISSKTQTRQWRRNAEWQNLKYYSFWVTK